MHIQTCEKMYIVNYHLQLSISDNEPMIWEEYVKRSHHVYLWN